MYPLTYQSYLSHLGEPSVCHKMSQVRRLWQLRRLVTKVVNEINREKFSRCTYFFRKSKTAYLQWGRVMISLVFLFWSPESGTIVRGCGGPVSPFQFFVSIWFCWTGDTDELVGIVDLQAQYKIPKIGRMIKTRTTL